MSRKPTALVPQITKVIVQPDPTTEAAIRAISKAWSAGIGSYVSPESVGRSMLATAAREEYLRLQAEQRTREAQGTDVPAAVPCL